MLNAETGDLIVDRLRDLLLRHLDLSTPLRRRTDNVEGTPGEHAGDGVEVGGIDFATHPRGFKGNRSATAERVGELGPMTETRDAQLLDQFRDRARNGTEMPVHLSTDTSEQLSCIAFFGPPDMFEPVIEAVR